MSWQWSMKQYLKWNWLVSSKFTWGIWQFLTWAIENLKNLHLNGLLLTKLYNFWAKKFTGVTFDGTEDWCDIWRKTELRFNKWHEKFGIFSPEYSKILKLGLWRDPFIQSRKCMSLKFTGELYVNENQQWNKIWRGIDLPVQNWHQGFDEF